MGLAPIQPPRAGDPITESYLRRLTQQVNQRMRMTVDPPLQLVNGASGMHLRLAGRSQPLLIQNDTGADLERGHVAQLGDPLIDEMEPDKFRFIGVDVADPAERKFVIARNAIKMGEIGAVVATGVCLAVVDVQDEDDTHAFPADGDFVLTSGKSGPLELLQDPDGTGEQELVVRFIGSGVEAFIGVLDEDLVQGGTATVSIWDGEPGSESDSGENLEDVAEWTIPEGEQLNSGCRVIVLRINGHPYVIGSRCCPEESE